MSADNGYIVARVKEHQGYYGIFSYFASNQDEEIEYTMERAFKVYSNPVAAIAAAYKIDFDDTYPSEYGVSINRNVWTDCMTFEQTEIYRVK